MNTSNDYLSLIFPDYSFSDQSRSHLVNYLNAFSDKDLKENIVILKQLLSQNSKEFKFNEVKGQFDTNESTTLKILQEAKEINRNKKSKKQDNGRSFKALMNDDDANTSLLTISTKDLIKYEFAYKFSIVYVDSFKDYPNPVSIINKLINKSEEFSSFTEFNSLTNKAPVNVGINYLSDPIDKAKMYITHLQVIRNLVYHHKNFKNPLNKTKSAVAVYGLGSLVGNSDVITVIAILILSEDGRLQLQDEGCRVYLDCSMAQWDKAYFPPGSVVICEGKYESNVFKAVYILQPPLPNKTMQFSEKLEYDFFGAITKIVNSFKSRGVRELNKEANKILSEGIFSSSIDGFLNVDKFSNKINNYIFPIPLAQILKKSQEALNLSHLKAKINEEIFSNCHKNISDGHSDIVIINNPNLADSAILEYIDILFSKLDLSPPCMIAFIGNFLPDSSYTSFKNQELYFDNLANLISKYTNINNDCIFSFIPGNEDIQISSSFPISPFPEYIVELLNKKIKNLIPCTNPARFSLFGKEVVFFRDELHKKLSRNNLGLINKDQATLFYMNTLFGQNNLAPLEQEKSGRVWHLAHSLITYPPPDYLIVADLTEDFIYKENPETIFINPGNFSRDTSFMFFNPLTGQIQACKVKND